MIQLSAWNSGVSHKRVLPIEAKRFLCKYRIAERCDDYSILIPVSYTIVATCMLQPTSFRSRSRDNRAHGWHFQ